MNDNAKRNVTLSIVGVALLVVAVVGVSFAFFSYLGTGSESTISVGQIYFSASQDSLELTNAFPTTEASAEVATVKVKGSTTYDKGVDFRVLVSAVNDNTDGRLVPTISVKAVDSLPSGVTVTPKTVTSLAANTELATGKIAKGTTLDELLSVLTISAYYSKDDYHISNTTDAAALKAAGLLDQSFGGTIILQDDWATYTAGTAYSFTIQVVATEGE